MFAHVGDRIVVEGARLGEHRRVGLVIAVDRVDGTPPYQVRWFDNDHTSLIFPGPEAHIEPATAAR
ncbi:DUF1918 domain-containing protein [Actinoplanes sp. NPDC049265]|uniref:DUF1918 domain-containing protein n=1 Tax=Actinoplanes sp. NPDC049265 TaxID=3363902 RepID=UPI0037133E8E